jgi:hypothetical protein
MPRKGNFGLTAEEVGQILSHEREHANRPAAVQLLQAP